jgi:hypothetical protein
MSSFRFLSRFLRDGGRRNGTPVRKPAWPRRLWSLLELDFGRRKTPPVRLFLETREDR